MDLKNSILLLYFTLSFGIIQYAYALDQTDNSFKMNDTLIRPAYLKAGDTVAIVAPSGILKNRDREVQQAVDLLKEWGLNAIVGEHVFSKADHFAGTDEERCEDL